MQLGRGRCDYRNVNQARPGDESLVVRRAEIRVLDCGSVVHVRSHTGVACTVAYCGVKIALLPLPAAARRPADYGVALAHC